MEWNELMSQGRLGDPVVIDEFTEKRYPRNEFEKDYKRILTSASFRRLQDKTQVFPLDKSDFVRTRLTHSYETSFIAKTLGGMILSKLKKKKLNARDKQAIEYIPEVLACAGLIHDIGNPPFGHFGEEIIKKWFTVNIKKLSIKYIETVDGEDNEISLAHVIDTYHSDFASFDGNAQALRVLTKLHFQDSDYGLNLTNAVLNTLIKYPSSSKKVKPKGAKGYNIACKKMGYFLSEAMFYERISDATGAKDCRHPLVYILEAADDIAYKTADIEDAFKKGLFTLDQLLNFIDAKLEHCKEHDKRYTDRVDELFRKLKNLRAEGANSNRFGKSFSNVDLHAMQNWIPYVQEWLMYCAAYCFDKNYEKIMEGTFEHDLFYETNHHCTMEILQDIMGAFIFPDREIVKLELSANTILTSLLDKFVPAVLFHDKKFESCDYVEIQSYEKIYNLISDNYREAYNLAVTELEISLEGEEYEGTHLDEMKAIKWEGDVYLRLLLAVDYVSGMTDSYAKALYQELNGI